MQITYSNKGCYFDQYQHTYPTEFYSQPGYTETRIRLADDVSQGELGEICFQGVRVHFGQFHTLKSDTIQTTENFPSVEMRFQLQGRTSLKSSVWSGFNDQQYNLSCRPFTDSQIRLEAGNHHYVGIQLTETFFGRFADDGSPTLNRMLGNLANREVSQLSNRNLPITPAIQAQLLQLTQLHRLQPLKRIYLELTVLDILRHQVEQLDLYQTKPPTSLKADDISKVLAVKELLDKHPLGTYSLLQLSRSVGLNDYKLKKGFREAVGTTVFGYLNTLRMDYARQLLRDTNKTVGEVADMLGYSETYHFSAAFKRKFGYLPNQR